MRAGASALLGVQHRFGLRCVIALRALVRAFLLQGLRWLLAHTLPRRLVRHLAAPLMWGPGWSRYSDCTPLASPLADLGASPTARRCAPCGGACSKRSRYQFDSSESGIEGDARAPSNTAAATMILQVKRSHPSGELVVADRTRLSAHWDEGVWSDCWETDQSGIDQPNSADRCEQPLKPGIS
jgi:hypothetical protein